MNDSFVKRIKRNECICCGHSSSHFACTPASERDVIRLYNGLPLCWACASAIVEKYEQRERENGWKVRPSEYAEMCDKILKTDAQMQEHFNDLCDEWKDLYITSSVEDQNDETDSDVTDTVIVQGMERDNIYDMEYIHDTVCDTLEDIMSNKRPDGTRYDIILREIIPTEKYFSLSILSRYRDQLREYCESHPEDFPKDGYPVILSKKEITGSGIGPIESLMARSEWAGKVTQIKWASDGDYHGIDKVRVRWLPTDSGKILHDISLIFAPEDITLVPVMMGYSVGSPIHVNDFDIHQLVGFMFILKTPKDDLHQMKMVKMKDLLINKLKETQETCERKDV